MFADFAACDGHLGIAPHGALVGAAKDRAHDFGSVFDVDYGRAAVALFETDNRSIRKYHHFALAAAKHVARAGVVDHPLAVVGLVLGPNVCVISPVLGEFKFCSDFW